MSNPFYSNVDKGVRAELNRRSKELGLENRSGQYSMYEMVANTTITAINRFTGKLISFFNVTDTFDVTYTANNKYLPKPVLTSVSITNEGRYGSLQRATINYKVFDNSQLDTIEPYLLIPGNTIKIKYGWSKITQDDINTGTFTGKIFNFSFTLSDDGGYDCTTEAIGEGFFTLGLDINTIIDNYLEVAGGLPLDASKNKTFTILNSIKLDRDRITSEDTNNVYKFDKKYGIAKFNLKPGVQYSSGNKDNKEKFTESNWYVTLGEIINRINIHVLDKYKTGGLSLQYQHENIISIYDKFIRSADPSKILFPDPDMGKYEKQGLHAVPVLYNVFTGFKQGDKNVDLSKLLISFDFLNELFDQVQNDESITGIPLNAFLNKVFNQIAELSGEIYNLTLVIPPEGDSDYTIEIHDTNFTTPDEKISVYKFEPFTKNSIIRNMSLDCRLPDKMATALYIGGTNATGVNSEIYSLILGHEEKASQPEIYQFGSPPKNQFNYLKSAFPEFFDPNYPIENQIEDVANKMGAQGIKDDLVDSLKALLKKYKQNNKDGIWNKRILYPLTLSITLDGINGFRFGNVISSDWLPYKYRSNANKQKIVFVVTKITHTISDNDWVTELETQCRLSA